MTVEQAKHLSIAGYLQECGHAPARVGENAVWFLSPLRNERTPSFKVDTKKNLWIDYGMGKGGSIIDLVMLMHGLTSVSEALKVLGGLPKDFLPIVRPVNPLPSKNAFGDIVAKPIHSKAIIRYLISRGVSVENARLGGCVELHYTLYGKKRYAIGFPNRSGGYEIRNQWFKGSISPKDITHNMHTLHDCVAVFEGFFDYLSFLELFAEGNKEIPDCLILNSVTNLDKAREILKDYDHVATYFDNDDAGCLAASIVESWFGDKVSRCNSIYEGYKDLNESISSTLMPIHLVEEAQEELAKSKLV